MNEPPDHTAELSAANLLSPGGMTVAKYFCTISGYSRSAVSMSVKRMPLRLEVFAVLVVHDFAIRTAR